MLREQGLELVFEVDDCRAPSAQLQARGVQLLLAPKETFYGVEAVAQDLYGNPRVLLEFNARSPDGHGGATGFAGGAGL